MGGRGASAGKGGGTGGQQSLVGKRVTDLGLTFENIEQKLGLKDLSVAQKNTLLNMFQGMASNDYSYDGAKTPYEIKRISITQPWINDDLIPSNDIQVSIDTGGNTGRYLVDSMDRRSRQFFIGKRGGTFTYSDNAKRKTVSGFEVAHGKLD